MSLCKATHGRFFHCAIVSSVAFSPLAVISVLARLPVDWRGLPLLRKPGTGGLLWLSQP